MTETKFDANRVESAVRLKIAIDHMIKQSDKRTQLCIDLTRLTAHMTKAELKRYQGRIGI